MLEAEIIWGSNIEQFPILEECVCHGLLFSGLLTPNLELLKSWTLCYKIQGLILLSESNKKNKFNGSEMFHEVQRLRAASFFRRYLKVDAS